MAKEDAISRESGWDLDSGKGHRDFFENLVMGSRALGKAAFTYLSAPEFRCLSQSNLNPNVHPIII